MRTKMKNMRTGTITERTFKSGEKFRDVELERIKKQYLYNEGNVYNFMDMATYEQIALSKEDIGGAVNFLKENTEVDAMYLDGKYYGMELPIVMELKVTQTEPGIKGDTVANVTKLATLETGVEVQVPLFINEGDSIRVDTRTGEYLERV